jgi:hypothetical protein
MPDDPAPFFGLVPCYAEPNPPPNLTGHYWNTVESRMYRWDGDAAVWVVLPDLAGESFDRHPPTQPEEPSP